MERKGCLKSKYNRPGLPYDSPCYHCDGFGNVVCANDKEGYAFTCPSYTNTNKQ